MDYALETNIDRLAGAHQRHEDDQAEAQDRAEARTITLTNDAEQRDDVISEHLRWCDQRNQVAEVLGKWAFEAAARTQDGKARFTEAERDQGILDFAHLILIPMAQEAIHAAAQKEVQ